MAGNILRGDASRSLGECFAKATVFIKGEFSLGMRIKIRAVAAQGEHQQKFSVHAWGGNILRGELGHCGI